MLDVNDYEVEIAQYDLYEEKLRDIIRNSSEDELVLMMSRMLHFIGLAGEVGELGEKIKKTMRDKDGKFEPRDKARAKEEGDIEWYLTRLESDDGFSKREILQMNLDKIRDRKNRGVQEGDGDER